MLRQKNMKKNKQIKTFKSMQYLRKLALLTIFPMFIFATTGDGTESVFYNTKGEVTNFVCGTLSASWKYDDIGNRIYSAKPNFTNYYTVNSLNQYTVISNNFGAITHLQYDADGNLIKDHRNVYKWDAENRLISIYPSNFQNGGFVVNNSYDYLHRRIGKEVLQLIDFDSRFPPSETNGRLVNIYSTEFFYNKNQLITEICTHSNGVKTTTHYIWGLDISNTSDGAGGIGGLLAVHVEDKTYFPSYDANGNVMEYVNSSGAVVAQYRYDPFGETIYSYGELKDLFHFRFSTKYHEKETFIYDYGRRFYDPWLGRWINRDPIGVKGGLNEYVACANDFVNDWDKDGLAYFAYRPLGGVLSVLGVSESKVDDKLNTVIGHEQMFFEDGKSPANIGFFDDSTLKTEANEKYKRAHDTGWNDCIMRKAIKKVPLQTYCLLGKPGYIDKYNCQDWAEATRKEYRSLLNDPRILKECCPTDEEKNK